MLIMFGGLAVLVACIGAWLGFNALARRVCFEHGHYWGTDDYGLYCRRCGTAFQEGHY